jgi:hypothetical protein
LTPINTGDWVTAQVNIDTNHPGPSCNLATGANCNYQAVFQDETTGASSILSTDHTMREGPAYALEMVFEMPGLVYNSCSDLPSSDLSYYSFLYYGNASKINNQYLSSYTVETPGSSFPFPFSNVSLNNGGNAYPSCTSISYPVNGSTSQGIIHLR